MESNMYKSNKRSLTPLILPSKWMTNWSIHADFSHICVLSEIDASFPMSEIIVYYNMIC